MMDIHRYIYTYIHIHRYVHGFTNMHIHTHMYRRIYKACCGGDVDGDDGDDVQARHLNSANALPSAKQMPSARSGDFSQVACFQPSHLPSAERCSDLRFYAFSSPYLDEAQPRPRRARAAD